MHVRLDDGQIKTYPPQNLKKVQKIEEQDELEPEAARILDIFRSFDTDGDGILDNAEFTNIMDAIGLDVSTVPKFLKAIDKDGDGHVTYEEFVKWALVKNSKSGRRRSQAMWPSAAPEQPAVTTSLTVQENEAEDAGAEAEENPEMTEQDVEKICGKMPAGWPPHGVKILNNMHSRFPDYRLQDIMFLMKKHGYIGGTVMHAIRLTGTREVENIATATVKVGNPDDFPAVYINRCALGNGSMKVYSSKARDFSFRNMRDNKMEPARVLLRDETMNVLEVRRGAEYGFCFGRISEGANAQWVVLGLSTGVGAKSDVDFSNVDRRTDRTFG